MAGLSHSLPEDPGHLHPDEGTLAAYLDGALAERERDAVEEHLADCRDCRRMLAATTRVLDERSAPPSTARRPLRRWSGRLIPIAVAASIGIVVLARLDRTPAEAPDPRVRSSLPSGPTAEGIGVITVYRPAPGDTVAARGLAFAWGATPAERYRFVLADAEGTPLWSVDTPDTTVTLPDSVALPPGRLHFWHVDAVSGGVAATTRLLRFTTSQAP